MVALAATPQPAEQPAPFTDERRHRLVAATLGAHASELVTVRAGDLRSALARSDDVERALELLGENATLRSQLDHARAEAAAVPLLQDRITYLEGQIAAGKERARLAVRLLTGKDS